MECQTISHQMKGEYLGQPSYLKLFDVGVVDAKTELVEFVLDGKIISISTYQMLPLSSHLDIIYDFLFEDLSLLENLFHGHAGNNDTSFTLDDALDNVLDMISLRWHDSSAPSG